MSERRAVDGVPSREDVMKIALGEARVALDAGEVPVGCVFVEHDHWDHIIATGHNTTKAEKNVCVSLMFFVSFFLPLCMLIIVWYQTKIGNETF